MGGWFLLSLMVWLLVFLDPCTVTIDSYDGLKYENKNQVVINLNDP